MGLAALALLFYWYAYLSVSPIGPWSIPVHHDDYTLYAAGGRPFQWSWIRPLSYYVMHILSLAGPDWLAWSIRMLTILYVFLSWLLLREALEVRLPWLLVVPFGAAVFASPIVVENARYLGAITQLLSGCLGLLAVVLLFRGAGSFSRGEAARGTLLLSALGIVLSTLAKEGFVVLYAFTLAYIAWHAPKARAPVLAAGSGGLVLSAILIAAAKFFSASSFLGVADADSTYHVNVAPLSILRTLWSYLNGGGASMMETHGQAVAALFLVSAAGAFALGLKRRGPTASGYLLLAGLAIMAPYTVLPNHVYPYYEILWLPLFVAGAAVVAAEGMALARPAPALSAWAAGLVSVALAAFFQSTDRVGRMSAANWYDKVGNANAQVFAKLEDNRAQIENAKSVCVIGADAHSPWFLHDGGYLRHVLGLQATWYLLSDPTKPEHSGFVAGAEASRGTTVVVGDPDVFPAQCVRIDLRRDGG